VKLSARNQLNGTVRNVELGAVMAEVTVDVDGQEIVAAITRSSAERLGLAEVGWSRWSSRPPRSSSASTGPDRPAGPPVLGLFRSPLCDGVS
jgi:molybdopterin-binding protein